jgi:hypothetical protein
MRGRLWSEPSSRKNDGVSRPCWFVLSSHDDATQRPESDTETGVTGA